MNILPRKIKLFCALFCAWVAFCGLLALNAHTPDGAIFASVATGVMFIALGAAEA